MDKSVLLKMSQEVLVIPFEEDIADSLDKFCRDQISEVDYDRMAELILCSTLKKTDEEIGEALANYMEENDLQSKLSAQVILPVLQEYIVLLIIDEAETAGQKATFSLMLKNALLGVVKGKGQVMQTETVIPTFGIYKQYLDEKKTFIAEGANELLPSFLDAAPETAKFELKGEDGKDKMKSLMYDAACYRYQQFIKELIITEEDVVQKVYKIVEMLVNKSPWMYVDKNPALTLKKLFGKLDISNVKLEIRDIISDLKPSFAENDATYNDTSILLCLLKGENDNFGIMNEDNQIDLIDFAVYLYYELQAERMMKENEIEKEEESNGE